MAIGTDNVLLGMRAALDVCARQRLAVASQARIENLIRLEQGKSAGNRFFAAIGVHMVTARAVAAFAPRVLRLLFAAREALEMRIAVKLLENRVVAISANVAAQEFGRLCLAGRARKHPEQQKRKRASQSCSPH